MGIIVDLIIVAFIALSVFLGYKKGLVSLAIKLISFIIAIVVTMILYRPIANFIINTTSIDETIQNTIYQKVAENQEKNNSENAYYENIVDSVKDNTLPELSRTIAVNVVNGGVMLILFVATRIVLIFVTALANGIAKLPILKQINEVGGIAYGFLRGIIIIYAILLVISVFAQINSNNVFHKNICESYVGKIMYENNVFSIFFK